LVTGGFYWESCENTNSMAELIPKEHWKGRHEIGHETFFLDVYRLLSHCLASRVMASIEDSSNQRTFSTFLTNQEKPEISRLLVHIATYYRIKYDDGSWEHGKWLQHKFQGVGTLVEDIKAPAPRSSALDFREACNKIIHATGVHFDGGVDPNTNAEYLNPVVYLYGSKAKKEWKATLDIVQFCTAANHVIV
jgi:hypothetical protein